MTFSRHKIDIERQGREGEFFSCKFFHSRDCYDSDISNTFELPVPRPQYLHLIVKYNTANKEKAD